MNQLSISPRTLSRSAVALLAVLALAAVVVLSGGGSGIEHAAAAEPNPCAVPVTNPVACENSKPGVPPEQWQVDGIGDETIQGFATQISVNVGGTESFKISTPSTKYHINILRLGYYGGNGARMIESGIKPSVSLPQKQPECMHEAVIAGKETTATGLIDCGNWAVSASWKVPTEAVSGLYMAELVREDVGGGEPIDHTSQIFFIVKNEASTAPIVLKTSDATWEAYNAWGGNSLYSCTKWCPEGEPEAYDAAYSVSYNRPFDGTLQTDSGQSDPLYAEYQLMRFLEKEGYNITYLAQPDIQAHPALLKNHKVFVSSGHDEYWSAGERTAVEEAREAGVNLAFFSGNEIFWKTRWGPSIDSSKTENRTLTTYKETHFNKAVDPLEPNVATSSWADPRFKSGGAGKPANSLSGQYFTVNSGTSDIKVPGSFAALRFWKNTAVSKLKSTETLTLSPGTGTLGYEWDSDEENGFRPPGRISLSSTTVNGVEVFTDYGTHVELGGVATHSLSLYRAPSGALVFGAGTVQWSWGLDNTNAWSSYATDPSENPPDATMQQATVNLFAEMGAQPSTLQSNLIAATASTDKTAPTAVVTSPTAGKTIKSGEAITISGTASDVGGVVAAVEVSTDGGKTWHAATGTSSWTYAWNVDGANTAKIEARAIDDSANIGAPTAGTTVSITCPCSMLGTLTPGVVDSGDTGSINLGVKFKSEVAGKINGIRFYKSTANTGTHLGSLWSASGELLAQATFSGETASGWQSVTFATPVSIQANTTYVASYLAPKGHYADTAWQLVEPPAQSKALLNHPPMSIVSDQEGGNGVYAYSSESAFPTQTYQATNYWVDVLYTPNTPPLVPGQPTGVSATAGPGRATVNWTAPTSGGAPASYKITPYIGTVAQTATTVAAPLTSTILTGLKAGTSYTFTVTAINEGGSGTESAKSNAVTPTATTAPPAPTGVTATAGGASATVKWTAPTSDGGSPITGYKVVPYRLGIAQTATTVGPEIAQTVITGLTVGSSYTFKVAAINAIGTGAESASSNSVIPTAATVPGAPTAVGATAKSSGAVLTWSAPAATGGSPISGYKITPFLGATAQTPTLTGSATPTGTVAGLTNGSAYTFKVAAINAIGTGAESTASAAVTPYDTIFNLATPGTVDSEDGGSVNLGVKFKSDVPGTVNGIRFYKSAANTGTHVGTLWDANGNALGQVTFTGESASGWQQATFATPVRILANTTYVASYLAPSGHYSVNGPNLAEGVNTPPLHAESGTGNGLYAYGTGANFPSSSFNSGNYWVDVLFVPEPAPVVPAAPTAVTATAGVGAATVGWTAPTNNGGSAITGYKVVPYKAGVAQTATTVGAEATQTTVTGLTGGSSYTFKVAAANTVGTGPESAASNAVTPTAVTVPDAPTALGAAAKSSGAVLTWTAPANSGGGPITGYRITPYLGAGAQTATTVGAVTTATVSGLTNGSAYTFKVAAINSVGTGAESAASAAVTPYDSIFDLATPATVDSEDGSSVNLGVKFKSDIAGTVNGIRFYKSAGNVGTHVGSLWSSTGQLLAQVTFSGESASGWQQANFSTPVKIQPNTTYVASYLAPSGHYSVNGPNFATAVENPPLHGLAGENGLYAYNGSSVFPTGSYNSSNYWVDVLFAPEAAPVIPSAPTAVSATAGFGSATVTWTAPSSGNPPTSYVITPYIGATAQTAKTITGTPPATQTTVSGLTPQTSYTFKVTAVNGAGSSPESAASNAIKPEGAIAPEAPTGLTVTPRNSGALLSWSEPADDGGSAITSYTVTPYLGSEALTSTNVGGNVTSVTVGSLQNGSTYTFKVTATNVVGPGPASAASAEVMPRVTLFEGESPAAANASIEDNGSVVLGVKFSSATTGQVRGIRFYKSAENTGTHVIGLWNQWGDLLAQATVAGESASGWQEGNFATPVNINAGTTYVAGYLAPKGHYAATPQGFGSAVTSGPLTGLADSNSSNGLYVYSSSLVFPVSSYNATNYWVDVLFTP